MQSGVVEKDFILFNSELAMMTDDAINDSNLSYLIPNTEIKEVQEVYNTIWSCSLEHAFVIMKDGILLFSLNSKMIVKCNKHTFDFVRKFENIQQKIIEDKRVKRCRTA